MAACAAARLNDGVERSRHRAERTVFRDRRGATACGTVATQGSLLSPLHSRRVAPGLSIQREETKCERSVHGCSARRGEDHPRSRPRSCRVEPSGTTRGRFRCVTARAGEARRADGRAEFDGEERESWVASGNRRRPRPRGSVRCGSVGRAKRRSDGRQRPSASNVQWAARRPSRTTGPSRRAPRCS